MATHLKKQMKLKQKYKWAVTKFLVDFISYLHTFFVYYNPQISSMKLKLNYVHIK